MTWLAGIGRYWDHPDPYWIQRLGVGSLLIVLALSVVVHGVVLPLKPATWSFSNLLGFISLTALPALLYAIPVERFLSLPHARRANVAFLATVAVWRVALLGTYLRRRAGFRPWLAIVALLLPVVVTITALSLLNLEKAVFDLMAGLREDHTPADAAYAFLFFITSFAFLASPALALVYLFALIVRRWPARGQVDPT